ncbi:IclR family transcriptional regulator [Rhodococcus wratislaviensis]|uniref:Putative IclR family transcriptional regulator n=1 Tax=Rhodococcus wratislaviensis NBRC 100605 TaxID=1219028 RepID=X0Q7X8_RHOWR|nr:IclR family transcriptional regulator [Rhodococcus wratislaviensis]GAF47542.1 putative IclR family transcriptional regulator [Rhodococcus wratislaviensis NBRC 100605]
MSTRDAEAGSRTLVRGLRILRHFEGGVEGISQAEMSTLLDIPLPTIGRLCRALCDEGFLEREENGRRLRLGPTIRQLSRVSLPSSDDMEQRWMQELQREFSEDINMAVLDGPDVLYVASRRGGQTLNVYTPIGTRARAHSVAAGKALLAELDESELIDALGPGPYEQATLKTIGTWPELTEQLAAIRTEGVARTWEEYSDGVASVARALPPPTHGRQAAIAVTMPTARATPERIEEVVRRISELW